MARIETLSVTPGPAAPRSSSGVVLLVEDEPAVRTVMRRMLLARGYTVLVAESADEALAKVAEHGATLDVLLTDVQLPGMDGAELAARIRRTRSNLKVVYISGYPREDAFLHTPAARSDEFIQKPFSPSQLGDVLARVLTDTPPPAESLRDTTLLLPDPPVPKGP